ncbi:MAG: CBS domain-containing protein [Pseudorhodobacter sp.]
MRVKSILNKWPPAAAHDASVIAVSRMMFAKNSGAVLIMAGGGLVGIVTDRDIVVRLLSSGLNAMDRKIEQIMTPDPFVCFDDQKIEDAAIIMADNQVRHLPVMDSNHALAGLLTLDLIAEHYSEQLAGETLGECVERRKARPRKPRAFLWK